MLRLAIQIRFPIAAFALLSATPALAQPDTGYGAQLDQLERQLDANIKACKPIQLGEYDQLAVRLNKLYTTWYKQKKSGAPIDLDTIAADRNRALALADRAKKAAADQCEFQQTKVEPPVLWGPGSPPMSGHTSPQAMSGPATNFANASKIYEGAKGNCDTAAMMAARAQMDAAIGQQRLALMAAQNAGATAIVEKLKAELKTMDDAYWWVDSAIRKCEPKQAGGTSTILDMMPKKRAMNPVAVGVIAGQAQDAGQQNSAGMGGWTGMVPVNGPAMGPEMPSLHELGAGTLGQAVKSPEYNGLGLGVPSVMAEEIGKNFDRFIRSVDPYGETSQQNAGDRPAVGIEWSFDGAKVQPYADTKVAEPVLPMQYWTARKGNIDPDFTGPIDIDLYPNAPIYLGVDPSPQPDDCGGTVPGMCEDSADCDWQTVPASEGDRCTYSELGLNTVPAGTSAETGPTATDVGLVMPPTAAMTPVDNEAKLELGPAVITPDSKPTDPGWTAGNGMEGKIGESPSAAAATPAEGGSAVYGPPPTLEDKIDSATRQYLEARRRCNQFDMNMARAKLEAIYMGEGQSKKSAKFAANAKLEQDWKQLAADHPAVCQLSGEGHK